MNTNALGLPETYNLAELSEVQKRDVYGVIYLGLEQYAVVETETGRTVGRLSQHPSGAWTAVSADGQRLLIDGGRHYYGDYTRQHIANLVVWQTPAENSTRAAIEKRSPRDSDASKLFFDGIYDEALEATVAELGQTTNDPEWAHELFRAKRRDLHHAAEKAMYAAPVPEVLPELTEEEFNAEGARRREAKTTGRPVRYYTPVRGKEKGLGFIERGDGTREAFRIIR